MKKQNNIMKMVSLKNLLVLSLALNVGLISRLLFDESKWVQEFYCGFEDYSKEGLKLKGGKMAALFSTEEVKVEPEMETEAEAEAEAQVEVEVEGKKKDHSFSGRAHNDGDVIDLDHGDPTMYEKYWKQAGEKTTLVISGWQSISYFSDKKNICWFLEPEFSAATLRLHELVGNAVTEGYHIVVGTGSTQLFQAVLYALCPIRDDHDHDHNEPLSVVSAAPFYSSYPLVTDFLKSGLYKWGGDAHKFNKDKPYIELVTSPNNPDGSSREAVVNGNGILVHDLAYYWPQYTPISYPADHNIMLFTVSKSTGHAGTRIGWALVKDKEIAKKMTKFIELNTIGVSKDSQLRAAKILNAVSDSIDPQVHDSQEKLDFFGFSNELMIKRWMQLRAAAKESTLFSLPLFNSQPCAFSGHNFEPHPAFAWLKCEEKIIEDCESFLKEHKILTRGGKHFGYSPKYVRISMLDRDEKFDRFTQRLANIKPLID